MKESSGTLLYRQRGGLTEVLIVHPSGHYNRHSPWSIPKGKAEEGEPLEDAARRETLEEAGVTAGPLTLLGSVELKRSRKRIHAFAGPAPEDALARCASWEVDRAEFIPLATARELLHPDQAPLIDRLQQMLTRGPSSGSYKGSGSDPRSGRVEGSDGG
jgi:predicted NUDIX family NTP pyrophosphohydrolase